MYLKSILIALALLASNQNLYAKMPDRCPSAEAIKMLTANIILSPVGRYGDSYVGYINNSFDTNDNWTFSIGYLYGHNESEARTTLVANMEQLKFKDGPNHGFPQPNQTECIYTATEGVFASVLNPPDMNSSS